MHFEIPLELHLEIPPEIPIEVSLEMHLEIPPEIPSEIRPEILCEIPHRSKAPPPNSLSSFSLVLW